MVFSFFVGKLRDLHPPQQFSLASSLFNCFHNWSWSFKVHNKGWVTLRITIIFNTITRHAKHDGWHSSFKALPLILTVTNRTCADPTTGWLIINRYWLACSLETDGISRSPKAVLNIDASVTGLKTPVELLHCHSNTGGGSAAYLGALISSGFGILTM